MVYRNFYQMIQEINHFNNNKPLTIPNIYKDKINLKVYNFNNNYKMMKNFKLFNINKDLHYFKRIMLKQFNSNYFLINKINHLIKKNNIIINFDIRQKIFEIFI